MRVGEEPKRRTVQLRIHGRVQGVGFRWWTVTQARDLGLEGWVMNRSDGAVEALFSGPEYAVGKMLKLCADGPSHAVVFKVNVVQEGGDAPAGFEVRRSA